MDVSGSLSQKEEKDVQEYADAVVSKMIVMIPPDHVPAYFFDKFEGVIAAALENPDKWSPTPPRLVPNGLFAAFERLWKVIYDGADLYSISPRGRDPEKRNLALRTISRTMKTSPKRDVRR